MAAREVLLRCDQLEVGYAGRALLPPVTLSFGRGELVVVIGRNGSGKTTWMRTVLGLLPPVSGRLERASGTRLAYLPQRALVDDLYPVLARDVVAMGMERGMSFLRWRHADTSRRVEQALEEMDAAEFGSQLFRDLSEGQKQRILFARLAASEANLALLDEPTSAMDVVAEREAYGYLARLRDRHGTTVVVVSHYLGLAREFAERAILIDRDTPAVVVGTPKEVFESESFVARYSERPPAVSDA